MKALIGVTAGLEGEKISLHGNNTESLLRAGALPFIIPYTTDETVVEEICERVDGLLLTGGEDIDPAWFGEEPCPGLGTVTPQRDWLEIHLVRACLRREKPIFAICRGCQILNVACGGTMYQDLFSQRSDLLQHMQRSPRSHLTHAVKVTEGSLLQQITGVSEFKVNSFHHQAIKRPAPGFRIAAMARDGVVEAVESPRHSFVLGVQWHPENTAQTDAISRRLFRAFVDACIKQKKGTFQNGKS
ncbi:gamma-glutamyl-gamma-aminobutyrate hydrolase family protein [Bacillaceae bacterium]